MNPRFLSRKLSERDSSLLKGFCFAFVAVLPSFVWIAFDKQPFGGDQSEYAMVSVRLYEMLVRLSPEWPRAMLEAISNKGPGIVWLGQLFVPLGILVGSVDHALLFLVAIIHLISLWLIYCSVLELSDGSMGAALVSVLVAGSAPLFVGATHLFSIEPFQMLIVAWFVAILSFVPKWDWVVAFGQLLLASCAAILIRATSPVYVWVLGLVILGYVIHRGLTLPFLKMPTKQLVVNWGGGFVLLIVSLMWYRRNLSRVIAHSRYSALGAVGAVWGKDDTYLNTLIYWVEELFEVFFSWLPGGVFLVLFIMGCWVWWFNIRTKKPNDQFFPIFTVVAIFQIVAVLMLFAVNTNRQIRFLLPLLPYLAVVIGWSISQIKRTLLTSVAIALLGWQFFIVYGVAFGWLSPSVYQIRTLWTLNTVPTNKSILEDVVSRTCSEKLSDRYLTIVAIDPNLRGDWLAPVPAAYTAAKRYGLETPCYFGYAGFDFFGASMEETWKDFFVRKVYYLVISDPSVYPPPQNALNQSLTPQNHAALMERIRSSGVFVEEPPLETDPGILVFRRIANMPPCSRPLQMFDKLQPLDCAHVLEGK